MAQWGFKEKSARPLIPKNTLSGCKARWENDSYCKNQENIFILFICMWIGKYSELQYENSMVLNHHFYQILLLLSTHSWLMFVSRPFLPPLPALILPITCYSPDTSAFHLLFEEGKFAPSLGLLNSLSFPLKMFFQIDHMACILGSNLLLSHFLPLLFHQSI